MLFELFEQDWTRFDVLDALKERSGSNISTVFPAILSFQAQTTALSNKNVFSDSPKYLNLVKNVVIIN